MQKAHLNTQLRMRPAISGIIRLFYPLLKDHDCVKTYPDVAGVKTNVCFISHDVNEELKAGLRSKINQFEASFIEQLVRYLIHQPEYGPQDITVITPYKGQMFEIRRYVGFCVFSGFFLG